MVIPLVDLPAALVSERLMLTGGNAKFLVGYKYAGSKKGMQIGVTIIEDPFNVALNQTRIGLTCNPFVVNNKKIQGWLSTTQKLVDEVEFADYSLYPQVIVNWLGLVNTPNPNFMYLWFFSYTGNGMADRVFFMENHNILFELSNATWNQLAGKTIIFKVITDDVDNHPAWNDPFFDEVHIPVTCATQQNGKITGLGGPCPAPNNSKRWSLSADRIIDLIWNRHFKFVLPTPALAKTFQFYAPFIGYTNVTVNASEEVVRDPGPWPSLTPFLKAKSDGNVPTKLLQLPACPP